MSGHNLCLYREIEKNIPKLTPLPPSHLEDCLYRALASEEFHSQFHFSPNQLSSLVGSIDFTQF